MFKEKIKYLLSQVYTDMQQDQFPSAERIIEAEQAPRPSSLPSTDSIIVSSLKYVRKDSALYWKMKYEIMQEIVHETNKKAINLNEILGLLPINKVKPNKVGQWKGKKSWR